MNTEKVLTYVNTIGLAILIILSFWHPALKLGAAAPSTATTFSDLNVDNSNGIGNASYYISGTQVLSSTGLNTSGSVTVGSGTAISKYVCFTSSWQPSVFSSSTDATTSVATANVALGDTEDVSFNSASSTQDWTISSQASAAGTSTATIRPVKPTNAWISGLQLPTSTLKVCYFH